MDGSTRYSLVVSRGYVRLVREGRRESRRLYGLRFARQGGDWVQIDPEGGEADQLEDWELVGPVR